ncbi:unnamed protein product [Ilex paraguariensis]|uniref:NADH dehydrogenase subunit 2 n=1 Tax=Ilex paraguariensis TaxID=185542 RepID=A0ABC8SI32_9AQUA
MMAVVEGMPYCFWCSLGAAVLYLGFFGALFMCTAVLLLLLLALLFFFSSFSGCLMVSQLVLWSLSCCVLLFSAGSWSAARPSWQAALELGSVNAALGFQLIFLSFMLCLFSAAVFLLDFQLDFCYLSWFSAAAACFSAEPLLWLSFIVAAVIGLQRFHPDFLFSATVFQLESQLVFSCLSSFCGFMLIMIVVLFLGILCILKLWAVACPLSSFCCLSCCFALLSWSLGFSCCAYFCSNGFLLVFLGLCSVQLDPDAAAVVLAALVFFQLVSFAAGLLSWFLFWVTAGQSLH